MNLAPRIEAALSLAPMTVAQLARCLSANPQSVRKRLDAMSTIVIDGRRASNGRPHIVYAVTNGH